MEKALNLGADFMYLGNWLGINLMHIVMSFHQKAMVVVKFL